MNPNDIEAREFKVANRGYDREEVNAFLRVVGAEVRRLQSTLKKSGVSEGPAPGDAEAGEPGSEPEVASDGGLETGRPAGDTAPPDPARTYRKVGDETARILVAAEQAAMEIKERGHREAAELVAAAREEAVALHRAAKAERGGLEQDIRQLHEARSLLGTEMEDMRRRFEELVLRLRQPFEVRHPKPKVLGGKRPPAPAASGRAPAPAVTPARALSPAEHFFSGAEPPMVPVGPGPADAPEAADHKGAPAGPEADEAVVMVGPRASIDVKAGGAPAALRSVNGNGTHAPEPEAAAPPAAEAPSELPPPPADAQGALDWRASVLGGIPADAARRLKRLLQEDQSDLLERLRAWRGDGPAANHVIAPDQHAARFVKGLREVLEAAFRAGRGAAGSPDWADGGDADPVIEGLVTKQLVVPLRRDLLRLIESSSGRDASATATSKRASDVYRVWKGVRTDLLGEGLVYAVFHQGLLDAVRGNGSAVKEWVVSPDEGNCPREVCRSNASAGPLGPDAPFPSGHLVPPAHGGCTCTLLLVQD